MTGKIHSFQSMGTVDGPGVRSVVFLQGCPLRCPYCHNPDTWDRNGGTEKEAKAVFETVRRYKSYFGKDGGVTVSGGEPLLQAEFVTELFTLCKAEGISTALDTSGVIFNESVKKLLAVTDIVLLDIKFSDTERYQKYIGIPLERVEKFLEYVNAQNKRIIIRQVVTPTVNDTPVDMLALKNLCAQYPCIEKIELLPFLKLCAEKYEAMGIEFPFGKYDAMDAEKTVALSALL